MVTWLESHKPVVSKRVQFLFAGGMWALVGSGLLLVGGYWTFTGQSHLSGLFLVAAILAGWLKSGLILNRTADRTIDRIHLRDANGCAGGFLSVRGWLLVAAMVVLGRTLRASPLPRSVLGFIYAAVGTGLLLSSRRIWQACRRLPPEDSSTS
ncbi:MAG: hypothetical protein JRJ12_08935 [Deltaproteobacteria bacterium]|nr:hypothetical protein [Deltaproteobacteria bacterium]